MKNAKFEEPEELEMQDSFDLRELLWVAEGILPILVRIERRTLLQINHLNLLCIS
jgi:hypothetical protein